MIGDKIKKIRNDKGLTQIQLGELAGITERTIQNYESNKRVPSVEILKSIAEVLKVSIMVLLESEITTVEIIKELQRRERGNDA